MDINFVNIPSDSDIYGIFQAIKPVWQLEIVSETLKNLNAAKNVSNITV